MRLPWLIGLVLVACASGDRSLEQRYARGVGEVLLEFEQVQARTAAACNRGPLECAVDAHDAVGAVRRSRALLADLTPPAKLGGAHQRLLAGFDHLAQAYDTVGDTYWDRSDLYGSYARAVRSMEKAVQEIGAAGVLIGFRGTSEIWRASR